ncbi:NUDIX hydrolase [Xylella taiwanensis]|uniref:GDP-mannose pyrophosphatase n=1 Tax=Xylella taiwanensis TaxID=1444770 RepID=Z9JL41_9GAMM|nr:NUDIX hydrolase [Xylella taiwanensis]AXI83374.1 DNA mismatch repair protein MutT [Xylella taiwanensis]EWS79110.1 DNA mismatch repair protein MutT [Xylella taiwanensis]MCD8456440.1 NUDIX hydrolase [Xylella taiwanensis]MCD8458847.1 NUDIX hydrolase [Xylella taiwanensis]MCD8460984.1 NUDIX hydrolase [Xylella taiwanensis]
MNSSNNTPHVVFEGKYQRMIVHGTWEYSERVHAGGLAAIILAVTPEDRVIFVEQFRVPVQQRTIEMPAGLVGDIDTNESIEHAAIRELEEETGWSADQAEILLIGPVSSGASSERIAFVRATGLHKVSAGGGDANEDIVVHEILRTQAAAWLVQKMHAGFAMDPKLWASLWLIDHALDGTPIR